MEVNSLAPIERGETFAGYFVAIRHLSTSMHSRPRRILIGRQLFELGSGLKEAGIARSELMWRSDRYKLAFQEEFFWVHAATLVVVRKFGGHVYGEGWYEGIAASVHQDSPDDLKRIKNDGDKGIAYLLSLTSVPKWEDGDFQACISDYAPEFHEVTLTLSINGFEQDLKWFLNISPMPTIQKSLPELISCVVRMYRHCYFELSISPKAPNLGRQNMDIFRRIIMYFVGFLNAMDKDHFRASYLIESCLDHNFDSLTTLFSLDIEDYFRIFMAITKRFFILPQEVTSGNHPALDVVDETTSNTNNDTKLAAEALIELPTEAVDDEDEDDNSKTWNWHEPNDYPKSDDFHSIELEGKLWEISWALSIAKIQKKSKTTEIKRKLKSLYWGIKLGDDIYAILVRNRHDASSRGYSIEYIENARKELELIKARGPYHPKQHPTSKKTYDKSIEWSLVARSEGLLAIALHAVGLLEDAKPSTLRYLLSSKNGKLFGTFDDGEFRIHFNKENVPAETVEEAKRVLQIELTKESQTDSLSSSFENPPS